MDIEKLIFMFQKGNDDIFLDWRWLIWNDIPLFYTIIWDAFLKNSNGNIMWLTPWDWKYNMIAENVEEFFQIISDLENQNKVFLLDIVNIFIDRYWDKMKDLSYLECLTYIKPPFMWGDYVVSNFHLSHFEVNLSMLWQVYSQMKDLPEWAEFNIDSLS